MRPGWTWPPGWADAEGAPKRRHRRAPIISVLSVLGHAESTAGQKASTTSRERDHATRLLSCGRFAYTLLMVIAES